MTFGCAEFAVLAAAAAIIFVGVKAFFLFFDAAGQGRKGEQGLAAAELELIEHEVINLNFFNYVKGTIRNNTDKPFKLVQVQLDIYSHETLMGTTTASTNRLQPGSQWTFQVPVLEQGAFQYKFAKISGER